MATKLTKDEFNTWCENLNTLLDKNGKEWAAKNIEQFPGVVLKDAWGGNYGITFTFKQKEVQGDATLHIRWDVSYKRWGRPDVDGDTVSPVEFDISVNFPSYGGSNLKAVRGYMACIDAATTLGEEIESQKNIFLNVLGEMTVIIETKEQREYKALKKSAVEFVENIFKEQVKALRKLQIGERLRWSTDIKDTTYVSRDRSLGGYTKRFNIDFNGKGILTITRVN